jgi:hypothetical protein
VHVLFANTERPETLDFVEECSRRWNVRVRWIEYRNFVAFARPRTEPRERWAAEQVWATAIDSPEPRIRFRLRDEVAGPAFVPELVHTSRTPSCGCAPRSSRSG